LKIQHIIKLHKRVEKGERPEAAQGEGERKTMQGFKANWVETVRISARNNLHVRKKVSRHCVLCSP
jgi:hypothetical protein